MSTELARSTSDPVDLVAPDPSHAGSALQHILGSGDLAQLTNDQRVGYYLDVCRSLGLNPRTRPFDFIEFYDPTTKAKKLTLYPNRSCAEQLRRQHQISVRVVRREVVGELFVVEVEGTTPTGRTGTASKYVATTYNGQRLAGQQLANAYMKAETGAMRRLTFSMVGMASPPDADELGRVRVLTVDGTGRVLENPTPEQKALAADPRMAASIGEPTFEDMQIEETDMPDQRVRPDELARPREDRPRALLKASEEDVKGWLGAWFGAVKGLSLDTDEARARYVSDWTVEWPKERRTDSLRTMFARMTAAEAGDFLARARALMDEERAGLLEAAGAAGSDEGDEPEAAF